MQTLSYGFQLPQTGDRGENLFTPLEQNIQKLNDHTHDGINSALINAFSIASAQSLINASGWVAFGGPVGEYRQLVTMAPGYNFDTDTMSFRTADGAYAYPKVLKNNDTSYYIYCNDPSVTFKVVYGG